MELHERIQPNVHGLKRKTKNSVLTYNQGSRMTLNNASNNITFFREIAHDINNMLTVTYGYLDLIDENTTTDHNNDYHTRVRKSVEAISELNEILLSGDSNTNICENIHSIIEIIENSLDMIVGEKKNINTSVFVGKNVNFFKINPVHLKRIVQNLLKNAVDAMPVRGEISIFVENVIGKKGFLSAQREANYIKITIQDNGIGIDEFRIRQIFHSGFTSKREGNGLGLKITQNLVQLNGGFIDVSSKKGSGTTFTLFFPAADIPII